MSRQRQRRRRIRRHTARKMIFEPLQHRNLLTGFDPGAGAVVHVRDTVVDEAAGFAEFTIERVGATFKDTMVSWETVSGTAEGGSDFAASCGVAVLSGSQTVVTIPIPDDALAESDETFKIRLSNAVGAEVGDDLAVATIVDDDAVGQRNTPPIDTSGNPTRLGDYSTTHRLPAGLNLMYNTQGAVAPVIAVETLQPSDSAVPQNLEVQLVVGGIESDTVHYDTSELEPGAPQRFVLQADPATKDLTSGVYPWQMTITESHGSESSFRRFSGTITLVNTNASPVGRNWTIDGVDQLVVTPEHAVVIHADGTSESFTSTMGGQYGAAAWSNHSLERLWDNSFELTRPDGSATKFDAQGRVTSHHDANGNATTFQYAAGMLTGITDPRGRTTTLEYANGRLNLVTDFAGRQSELEHDPDGHLMSVTDPDPDDQDAEGPPTTSYGYHPTPGLMFAVTDPSGETGHLMFDVAGHLESMQHADGSRVEFDPAEMQGLVVPASGIGTAMNPARIPTPDETIGQMRDELGHVWRYRFDAFGNVVQSIDPAGNVQLAETNSHGQFERIVDPLGRTTELHYEDGKLTQITWPDSTVRQWSYDAESDRPVQVIDELGRTTLMSYDTAGNLIDVTQVIGQVDDPMNPADDLTTSFTYSTGETNLPLGLRTSITDAAGTTTIYEYGETLGEPAFGQLIRVTAAVGSSVESTTVYEYDEAGNLAATIDPLGHRTQYSFDRLNRLDSLTLPATNDLPAATHSFGYDPAGRLTIATGPTGGAVHYAYDDRGRLAAVDLPDPDGSGPAASPHQSYVYDARGQIVEFTAANGIATSYQYDALGRMTHVVRPPLEPGGDPLMTTYDHDVAGRRLGITDSQGQTTEYEYDSRNRVTGVRMADPDGLAPEPSPYYQYAYDAAGQMIRAIDPSGREFLANYDDAGRRTSRLTPSAVVAQAFDLTEYAYDEMGNQVSMIDPSGVTTTYHYDALGRLTASEMADPDGAGPATSSVTSFHYDVAGNRIGLIDALGNQTQWVFDARRQVVAETDSYGNARKFEYDQRGNRTAYEDREGRRTRWHYDALDRVVQEDWITDGVQVESLRFGYGGDGRLIHASDNGSSYDYDYDALGRLGGIDLNHAGQLIELRHQFDDGGNRTEFAMAVNGPSGLRDDFVNQYAFDAMNRMTQVVQSSEWQGTTGTKSVTFQYDASNRLDQTVRQATDDPNAGSLATHYLYDAAGRLNQLVHTGLDGTLSQLDLEHDASGRLIELQAIDSGGDILVSQYDYDEQGRLASETRDGAPVAMELDALGNPANAVVEAGNRLTTDGSYEYEYDAEGNRIRRTRITGDAANDWLTEYAWDHRNRLIAIRQYDESGQGTLEIEYGYDVFGNRIRETVAVIASGETQTTTHVYDGDQLVASFDLAGATTHRYLYGPGVDQILADERLDETSGVAEVSWTLTDHLGSVVGLADVSGEIIGQRQFDAYGKVIAGEADVRFGFTGQTLDPLTGLQHHRARYYDPEAGRWLSEDPLGFGAGDANVYRYVGNNPTNFVDPSGLRWQSRIPWYRDAMIDIDLPDGHASTGGTAPQNQNSTWFVGFLQGLMPNFGRPGRPYPTALTAGIGGSVDVHLGTIHLGAAIDAHVGVNPYASNPLDIVTVGVTLSVQYAVCSSLGLGCAAGVEVIMTDAPYVGALEGISGAVGGQVGPVTGEYITSQLGTPARPRPGTAPAPDFHGVILGVGGGAGGGGHVDEMTTVDLFHSGPTNPPATYGPTQMNGGDGSQYLNPND